MEKLKHTPGPWSVEDLQDYWKSTAFYIRAPRGQRGSDPDQSSGAIAFVPRSTRRPMRANAQLIASAPELLGALQAIVLDPRFNACECGAPECRTTRARAAIAKATGSAS